MKQTEPKRNDTKQQIFSAALELFAQKGFKEVTIRDIAKKVDIKGASIYYHYASKEDILTDILKFYDERTDFYIQQLAKTNLDEIPLEEYPLKMHFSYQPEEAVHMFLAAQVVVNEQLKNRNAAESLLGTKFDDYTKSYEVFFRAVASKLWLDDTNCVKYAEILTRISIVYMMQFQHVDMFDAEELFIQMDEMYKFVFNQFLKVEKKKP